MKSSKQYKNLLTDLKCIIEKIIHRHYLNFVLIDVKKITKNLHKNMKCTMNSTNSMEGSKAVCTMNSTNSMKKNEVFCTDTRYLSDFYCYVCGEHGLDINTRLMFRTIDNRRETRCRSCTDYYLMKQTFNYWLLPNGG